MATTARSTREPVPTAEYARLEDRIIARDQKGASDVLYGLMKQERPVTEILRETIRIHAPYTNVPYHQRLDDGVDGADMRVAAVADLENGGAGYLRLGGELGQRQPDRLGPGLDLRNRRVWSLVFH